MKCDLCNNKMIYFEEKQTCGWKCVSCGNTLVTTNDDGIFLDDSIYTIFILAGNSSTPKNINCIAKIIGCSFIDAKKYLEYGKEIGDLDAIQCRDILKSINSTEIKYTIIPEFTYNI